jgi:hypothetical protein
VFKALAFLAGLGSAACGLLCIRQILLFLSERGVPQDNRVGLIVALLGFSLSLGIVAILMRRWR